jgi:hypothetical protein
MALLSINLIFLRYEPIGYCITNMLMKEYDGIGPQEISKYHIRIGPWISLCIDIFSPAGVLISPEKSPQREKNLKQIFR